MAGIISEKPSTALSHVNVLARGWGIPNIYLKDAEKILAPYIGRRIEFEATVKQYRIVQTNQNTFSDGLTLPQPDVSDYSLRALSAPILPAVTYLTDSAFRLPTITP